MILGVDPGLTGGLALLGKDGRPLRLSVMPAIENQLDLPGLVDFLQYYLREYGVFHVYLEQVHSMPKQGVASSFKFGRVYGAIEGVLSALGIPYTLVTPQRWTKEIHQGLERSLDAKSRSRLAASRLFPGVDLRATERSKNPHAGLVDALLIAEYGRRAQKNEVKK